MTSPTEPARFLYADERYNTLCQIVWHPGLANKLHCRQEIGHDGNHAGFGFSWDRSPDVDDATALRFFDCYRRIPNSNHDITLRDDGMVEMTMKAFGSATAFIHVRSGDD